MNVANQIYDIIRERDDLLNMIHEDDRSNLVKHLDRLRKIAKHRRDQIHILAEKYSKLAQLIDSKSNKLAKDILIKSDSNNENPKLANNTDLRISRNDEQNTTSATFLKVDSDIKSNINTINQTSNTISMLQAEETENKFPLKRRATISSESDHRVKISKPIKFTEPIRKKDDRAQLPGFTCHECEKFYKLMVEQGVIDSDSQKQTFLNKCSRHKAQYTPPSTPDGFWDLSLNTPADWHNVNRN